MSLSLFLSAFRGARRNLIAISGSLGLGLLAVILTIPGTSLGSPVEPTVAGWTSSHFAGRTLVALDQHSTSLPFLKKIVHLVKAVDKTTGEPVGVTFDEAGVILADQGRALQAKEESARFADHGAISDELWVHMWTAAPEQVLEVGLWLYSASPTIFKEIAAASEAGRAVRAERDAAATTAHASLATQWPIDLPAIKAFAPGAPAAYAALTSSQIWAAAKLPAVAAIVLQKPYVAGGTDYVAADNGLATGFTGTGANVCIIEQYQPSSGHGLTLAATYCGGGTTHNHGRVVLGTIRSSNAPYGLAPATSNYFASWTGCDTNAAGAFNWCGTQYPTREIWNWSHTCSPLDERLIDYWVRNGGYPLFTVLAGNSASGNCVNVNCGSSCHASCPGTVWCMTHNALVVGGTNTCATTSRSDDEMWCSSQATNPATDRELPHLVAPAQNIDADGLTNWSGTSFAAPQVAAIAAQILHRNSGLALWPEALRSILMASADTDIDGTVLSLSDATDDKDGAGAANALLAVALADSQNNGHSAGSARALGWDKHGITSASTPAASFYSETWSMRVGGSGYKARVVLSWDGTVTCTNPGTPGSASCNATALDADLDLYVYDGDNLVARSNSSPNSFEFAEFTPTAGTTYTIKVWAHSWIASGTYFGLAWLAWPFN